MKQWESSEKQVVKEYFSSSLTREYKINKNSGEILIDNKNIYDIDQQDFYKNVSVVFQKPLLLSGTIKSNVMLGANLENESNLNNALLNSKADFVFKLDDSVEHKVYQEAKTLVVDKDKD